MPAVHSLALSLYSSEINSFSPSFKVQRITAAQRTVLPGFYRPRLLIIGKATRLSKSMPSKINGSSLNFVIIF